MTVKLLLDEHFAEAVAVQLREGGHDVLSVVADLSLRAQPDAEVFRRARDEGRRIVTENVKDFRPLLLRAYDTGEPVAALVLVPPGRLPGGGQRTATTVRVLEQWLAQADAATRPDEDWLT